MFGASESSAVDVVGEPEAGDGDEVISFEAEKGDGIAREGTSDDLDDAPLAVLGGERHGDVDSEGYEAGEAGRCHYDISLLSG